MATLNIRISEELNNNLAGYAKELERPRGYIVRKALENYFQELREDREDIRIAVSRMKDPNKKFYTSDEVQKKLDKKFNV